MPKMNLLWAAVGLMCASLTAAPVRPHHAQRPETIPTSPLGVPLIFIHVPKTGGQTVARLVDSQFDRKTIFPYYFYYNFSDKPDKDPKKYSLIRGHIFYSQVRHIQGKKITFIREPVQRTLSEHRFWLRFSRGRNQEGLVRLHFLPPGDPLYVMSNHQCQYLSSYDPRDPTITIQQHLDSAIENLTNDFCFVGITEDLDNGIRSLFSQFGWQNPEAIPRLNSTKPTDEVFSDELLEEVRQRNWADIKLYEIAKQLYETRYTATALNLK